MDVSVGHMLKGLAVYAVKYLAAQGYVCCADRSSLPQSVRQWGRATQASTDEGLPAMLEGIGRLVCIKRVYQTMPYLPLN